jgi:hypothetical protein
MGWMRERDSIPSSMICDENHCSQPIRPDSALLIRFLLRVKDTDLRAKSKDQFP